MFQLVKPYLFVLLWLAVAGQASPAVQESPWGELVECSSGDNILGRNTVWINLRRTDGSMVTVRMHSRDAADEPEAKFMVKLPNGDIESLTKQQESLLLKDLLPLWDKLPGTAEQDRMRLSTDVRVTVNSFERILKSLKSRNAW